MLRIDLLGSVVRITIDGREIAGRVLQRRQDRLALAFVVLERSANPSKERLADALWPHTVPATWETALRGVISRVRTALVEVGVPAKALQIDAGEIRLSLPFGSEVDVDEAVAALAQAERAAEVGKLAEASKSAMQAATITERAFLPDCSGEWVDLLRLRLATWHQRALAVASNSAFELGDHRVAQATAEQALATDPYAEWAYRVLMQTQSAAGERAAALASYAHCQRVLRDDLGIHPATETQSVYLAVLGAEHGAGELGDSRLPMVGRQHELGVLASSWARARSGRREAVVIVGEPGAGKSRLANEFAASVEGAGHLVLRGSEDAFLSAPFRSLREAVSGYIAARGTAVIDGLGSAAVELSRLSATTHAQSYSSERVDIDARRRLFESVRSWLVAITRTEPVLLVIDNLQWASPATAALLLRLLDDEEIGHLLVVSTCRVLDTAQPQVADTLAELVTRDNVRRLSPPPLSTEEVGMLLDGASCRLGPDLAHDIAEGTGGNPLFVCEIIRHLLHRLQRSPADLSVATGTGSLVVDPVDALEDLVELRLRAVGSSHREVVHLAALAGNTVDLDLLLRVTGDAKTVHGALARAGSAGLITLDEWSLRFRHDLIRRTVERRISPARLPEMHRALAEALDGRCVSAELSQRAHHWEQAAVLGMAEAERAIDCHLAAGRWARSRLDFERAAHHCEAGLRILAEHDPASTWLKKRCDLLIDLGRALRDAGDPRCTETLDSATRVAYLVDDPVCLARAALAQTHWGATQAVSTANEPLVAALADALQELPADEGELRARVKASLAVESRWTEPDVRRLWAMADESIDEARQFGTLETVAAALVGRHTLGHLDPATCLADASELRAIATQVHDPAISCEGGVIAFDARIRRGELARADVEMEHVERVAEQARLTYFRWIALTRRAGWHAAVGNDEAAQRASEEATTVGLETGVDPTLIFAPLMGLEMSLCLEQGRAADAVAALSQIEAFAGEEPGWITSMAVALAEDGELESAARWFERGLTYLDVVAENEMGLLLLMNLARAGARLGDTRATRVRARLGKQSGELSWFAAFSLGPIDLGLAWTWRAEGDLASASDYLEAASALCRQAGSRTWLRRVAREQAAIAAPLSH
jgi:DNA-binding SARP family transcriptional activator